MFRKLLKRLTSSVSSPTSPPTSKPAAEQAPSADALMAPSVEVTEANFAAEVLAKTGLVIVDFWAEWCQPCTIVEGYLAVLARDYPEQLTIAAVDVDEESALAERYQVMGLPTLLFFRDGVEVDRVTGVVAYETLHTQVAELLSPETDAGASDSTDA